MDSLLRSALAFALLVPACDVAGDPIDDAEIAMSDGGERRVLGKRAFDSATAGYPVFERLTTEAPRRTLTRASDHLDRLQDDLECMRAHTHADDLSAELAHAESLLQSARERIADTDDAPSIADAQVDDVVALVGDVQALIEGVRARRIERQPT